MSKAARIVAGAAIVIVAVCVAIGAGFRLAAALREVSDRDAVAPSFETSIATRSGRLFLQDKGSRDGTAVVLIHGTAAWSQLWWRTTDALTAAGYRVVALDMPPFGFSDRPGSYTRTDQAGRIADVLAGLGIGKAIIVGHSFGAGAATEFALRFPDRVRGLVLVDAALGLTAPPSDAPALLQPEWLREVLVSLTVTNPLATRTLLRQLIARKDAADEHTVDILQAPMTLRHSTTDIAQWLLYFTGADRDARSADRHAVAELAVPAALLWDESDTVTPLAQATDLRTLLPKATLTVLPGLGHIPQIEDPAVFNQALIAVLATL